MRLPAAAAAYTDGEVVAALVLWLGFFVGDVEAPPTVGVSAELDEQADQAQEPTRIAATRATTVRVSLTRRLMRSPTVATG
jgi:hypothetical protein